MSVRSKTDKNDVRHNPRDQCIATFQQTFIQRESTVNDKTKQETSADDTKAKKSWRKGTAATAEAASFIHLFLFFIFLRTKTVSRILLLLLPCCAEVG